jgi:hypothetical protein
MVASRTDVPVFTNTPSPGGATGLKHDSVDSAMLALPFPSATGAGKLQFQVTGVTDTWSKSGLQSLAAPLQSTPGSGFRTFWFAITLKLKLESRLFASLMFVM